jgi:RNA polymerase sigma factor (sigma-70 family)
MLNFEDVQKHYIEHRKRHVKVMAFLCGSGAAAGEDIVQTAYERALKYLNNCRDGEFPMWFSQILLNSLRDWKRVEKGYSDFEHEEDDDDREGEDLVCQNVAIMTMKEILEEVRATEGAKNEVLTLHFEHNHSAKDISRITEYSYAQCHKTINRFQHYLRTKYV